MVDVNAGDCGWCVVGVFPKTEEPVALADDEVSVWGPFDTKDAAERFGATVVYGDGSPALVSVTRIRNVPPLGPRLLSSGV